MKSRATFLSVVGLAVAVSTTALAQDTVRSKPRSEQRIQVSKGEVVQSGQPRVDTVFVARTDTVFVTRRDTVRVPRIIVRTDTVFRTPPPPPMPVRGALYGGLYGGLTAPTGNVSRLYGNGAHLGGMLGWEPEHGVLGGRVTADLNQLSRESGFASNVVGTATPLMFSAGSDLKVMPLSFETWRVYGIGGVNYHVYRGIATVAKSGTGACAVDGKGGCYQPTDDSWKGKLGFNVGGGSDFRIGSQEMFVEARVTALQADGARTWFLPISLGLRFF